MANNKNTEISETVLESENAAVEDLTDEEKAEVDRAAERIANDLPNAKDIWGITLSKPVTYEGEEIKELTFNFGKLTGDDAINIEEELRAQNKPIFMNEAASTDYLMAVAVRTCERAVDMRFFRKIKIVDFLRIKSRMRLFLLGVAAS